METVYLVLVSWRGDLARVELTVQDPKDCGAEILTTMSRVGWVLSVGDRVEIRRKRNEKDIPSSV